MFKRMVAVFTAFAVLYGCICVRLYSLSVSGTDDVNSAQRRYTINISEIRGEIFDCNGEKLVMIECENVVAAKPTYKALTELAKVLDADELSYVEERIRKSNAITLEIGKSTINENSDVIMLRKFRRYAEKQPAVHILGYRNGEGRGVYGIEKSFDEVLYSDKCISVSFTADVYGRILGGTEIMVNNSDLKTGSVMLSVDSRIQKTVEDALDKNGVKKGGAVVVEIETGAIRAAASRPAFDADNVSEYLADKNSPLINRALNPYSVGSVFKVIVAAAALENGEGDFLYECTGSCEIDGTIFSCNKKTSHGKLDLTKALECSCNTYFIRLAEKVGAESILETASLMGFGQEIQLADSMISKSGVLPSLKELSSSGAFANFSFGQGRFTATMLQLSNMMSAVANKGKYNIPYLVEKVTDADGNVIQSHTGGYPVYALSGGVSERLTRMLVSVVENGNAVMAKPSDGIFAAGKTATAQTGVFNPDGTEVCNTWFAGFFPADNPKYSVVVLREEGSSGAVDCAPIFKCIADEIIKIEKNS
ncbi:MAG: penicillin-binding protein 2 [Acutalibacteraceae bacterium]|nr:penicillin-binding protein 2 [Acutalibacteraceae bacterium]